MTSLTWFVDVFSEVTSSSLKARSTRLRQTWPDEKSSKAESDLSIRSAHRFKSKTRGYIGTAGLTQKCHRLPLVFKPAEPQE